MPRPPNLLSDGHRLELLEGATELFPAMVRAMEGATREIWLETYIFDFTGTSSLVAQALERAARRGLQVRVVVDGFGTAAAPPHWRDRLAAAGVDWQVYSPVGHWSRLAWPGSWRRLHRKLCLIDGRLAFCGGINILDDLHDPNHGPLDAPRLDFCVRIEGPLVSDVRQAMSQLWLRLRGVHGFQPQALASAWWPRRVDHENRPGGSAGRPTTDSLLGASPGPDHSQNAFFPTDSSAARAGLMLRDNLRHRSRIERAYLRAIGRAREEVLIANAYFVPGRRLRLALERAAQRGVRVTLLLQGRYEYFMQYYASRTVCASLVRAGVSIHEYAPSFLHAKVAVIDGHWATVGSSNLDPLSLLLAREANVVVEDVQFATGLRQRLLQVIALQGQAINPADYALRSWRQRTLERLALMVMRLALLVQGQRYL